MELNARNADFVLSKQQRHRPVCISWNSEQHLCYSLTGKKINKWAAKCDFQHWGSFTSVDSENPVQPPLKLRNYKWCLISSLIFIDYQSDRQRVWSDCPYGQAGLSICWLHRPHCCKSHVAAQINLLQAMSLFSCIQAHTQVIISYGIWAAAWDFQQFDILTSVDSDEPVQPPVKLRNSKQCSVSS